MRVTARASVARAVTRTTRRARAVTRATEDDGAGSVPGTDGRTTRAVRCARPLGLTLEGGAGDRGCFVARVASDGNAARAGGDVRANDVVGRVGGRDARGMTFDAILDAIGSGAAGEVVELELTRWPTSRDETRASDRAWLEYNSTRADVTTLPSGLQYRVVERGTGRAGIKMDTACECHYVGTLLDGTEFDSSYRRGKPLTFAPRQVIKAWQEAMRLMREGDKWEIFCPAELAYGGRGSGRFIKPGDALIFTMSIERVLG